MKSETQIKDAIRDYLNSLGDLCWHVPYHNMGYGVGGTPDRLACYRGTFIAPEVKRVGEKARKRQKTQHDRINASGGIALVVTSVEEVQDLIAGIDRKLK